MTCPTCGGYLNWSTNGNDSTAYATCRGMPQMTARSWEEALARALLSPPSSVWRDNDGQVWTQGVGCGFTWKLDMMGIASVLFRLQYPEPTVR